MTAAAFIAAAHVCAHAEVLDFDDLEAAGDGFIEMAAYSSQNYSLTTSEYPLNGLLSPLEGNKYYFGSANLINAYRDLASTILSQESNAPFGLESIDVHGMDDLANVTFCAYNNVGEIVGTNPVTIADSGVWQTITFGEGFGSVHSVVWEQTEYFAFDNIRLNSVVPEPLSCILFGIGGLTLACAGRLRKK